MQQIHQVVYVVLYLQFFAHNAFTFDTDILSEKYTHEYINDFPWTIKWECESDVECTVTNSTCIEKECQCSPGYIYNSNMTLCVKVATGLYDPCEDTLQCSAYLLSGAVCIDNVCECGPGYYYLHGRCNRYVGLFERCEQNDDCYVNADFEASTCNMDKKICECSPGFYQREYRTCRRMGKAVGDECMINLDCQFKNAICQDFICFDTSESKEAIELSTNTTFVIDENEFTEIWVGSNCTTDDDCKKHTICDVFGKCRCDRAYFASQIGTNCTAELGESCETGEESDIQNSICRSNNTWSCTNGTVVSGDNRECRNVTTEYHKECSQNEDCYIFGPDAVCDNNECVCNANSHYVEDELFCWGNNGVDEPCMNDYDCYVEGFIGELMCNDGTCGCLNGTRLNRNKTACISPGGVGEICEIDEDCATENAICNVEEEVCECIENYYPLDNQCLPGINASCNINKDCMPDNSECDGEVQLCSCKKDYVSASISSCLPILSYGEPCLEDIQCFTRMTDAICANLEEDEKDIKNVLKSSDEKPTTNKTCTCDREDHYRFGRCYRRKLLSETCENLGECYLAHNQNTVMCMNGECRCNWGYMKWNESICLKDARYSVYIPNDGIINVVSTGLLSIALLLASCDIL